MKIILYHIVRVRETFYLVYNKIYIALEWQLLLERARKCKHNDALLRIRTENQQSSRKYIQCH